MPFKHNHVPLEIPRNSFLSDKIYKSLTSNFHSSLYYFSLFYVHCRAKWQILLQFTYIYINIIIILHFSLKAFPIFITCDYTSDCILVPKKNHCTIKGIILSSSTWNSSVHLLSMHTIKHCIVTWKQNPLFSKKLSFCASLDLSSFARSPNNFLQSVQKHTLACLCKLCAFRAVNKRL